jgi:hypothetical protein
LTGAWEIEIACSSNSFEGIKRLVSIVAQHIENAATPNDVPAGGGGGAALYLVTLRSPVAARIAALRAEADRLERELRLDKRLEAK